MAAGFPVRSISTANGMSSWVISVVGMLIMFLSNGLTASGTSVFDPALLDEFGWTRADLKFRDVLTFWPSAVSAPLIGLLVDRMNPRYLLLFGLCCLSLGLLGYSVISDVRPVLLIEAIALLAIVAYCSLALIALRVSTLRIPLWTSVVLVTALGIAAAWLYATYWMGHAIKQAYVIHLLFSLVISCAGGPVVIVLVSSWCERRRGLSIGIALLGTSLGSAFLPVANAFLIAHYDWRFAMQVDAILPIIGAVVVFLTVRGLPRHSATATSTVPDPEAGFAFMEAIRTRAFWAIAASGFLTYAAIFGFVQHLVLHMTKGLGYTLPQAAQALLWYSFLAMIAKLTSGALADRMDRHKVFLSCLVVMFVGTLLLATMRRDLLMASVVAIALGWGGLFTLYNMLAVSNFGLREIGRIIGSIIFFENLGIGIGSWLTGRIYDYFGSYQIAFIVIVMMLVLGLVVGSQTRLRSPTAAGTT